MYKVPNYCHYFFCSKDDNFKGLNEPGASVAGKLKGDWGFDLITPGMWVSAASKVSLR